MSVQNAPDFLHWTWSDIEPLYADLQALTLTPDSIDSFLRDWSTVSERVQEIRARLYIATTQNTADEEAKRRYHAFLDDIFPKFREAEQRLQKKFLVSGIEPEGFEALLRGMRTDVDLFRQENLPLHTEQAKLSDRYSSITGNWIVEWDGKPVSLTQLRSVLSDPHRERRERAWRLAATRMMEDRDAIGDIWNQLLSARLQEAANAGFGDYLSYRWLQLNRFDYSPEDAKELHRAVEEVVVPVVDRLYQRRRARLGVKNLRPWDLECDPFGRPAVVTSADSAGLTVGISTVFHRLEPDFGEYFDTMSREGLLDVESRLNKATIGYMYQLPASRRPFIFFESTGTRLDVDILLHEVGHAVHVFESSRLPYSMQRTLQNIPAEFKEAAAMAMEFLGEPHLTETGAGFFSESDAARARLEHIEDRVLALWCLIACADSFQHWIYENPGDAADLGKMNAVWTEHVCRFIPVVDWSGLPPHMSFSDWQALPHIFRTPLYMIEYALAQLAAVQIAANARSDEREAIRQYRAALSLGGTKPLPELFSAAGATFAFNADDFRSAVEYLEGVIEELEAQSTTR